MNVLVYRVTLLEPTLVTALEGDPNSGVSFPYLPGSTLRGIVIAKYQHVHRVADLAGDANARRLFFDGTTRYLNAYPLDRLDYRTAPTPLSLHRMKGQEGPIHDFASQNPPKEQWQMVNTPFCRFSDNDAGDLDSGYDDDEYDEDSDDGGAKPATIRLVQPERQINVHTTRNRRFGRAVDPGHAPGEDPGAVYRYDALAAGQTFEAAILCDHAADVQVLQCFLSGEIHLGRSRSAGYGRARLDLMGEPEADWKEVPTTGIHGKWVVTFLSDALVRAANGQFTIDPQAITKALEKRLGVSLFPYNGLNDTVFVRGRETGGFNRQWNLPLPQALAVQMGSTLVYEAPQCAPEKIRELEEQGIGERRAEGFGRIAVNWHGYESELSIDNVSEDSFADSVDLSQAPEVDVARGMVHRMWRKRLDGAVVQVANRLGQYVHHPKNSQLSRLRAVLQDALLQSPETGRPRIVAYLKDLENRQSTRRQFGRDRVAGKGLLEWLRFRVKDEADIWQALGADTPSDLPRIGGIDAEKSPELAYEYNLRLVDAVLAQAAKQNR